MPMEIFTVLMHEPRLCTYHELDTVYTLDQLYDFLEMIEVSAALKDEMMKEAERNNGV